MGSRAVIRTSDQLVRFAEGEASQIRLIVHVYVNTRSMHSKGI
jgi:hypothetical protein